MPENKMTEQFRYRFRLLWIALLVLIIDGVSKGLTYAYVPAIEHHSVGYPYGGIPVFEDFLGIEFSFSYATNLGAAWGLLDDYPVLLMGIRLLMIVGLLIAYFVYVDDFYQLPLLNLIIGGAIGNVIDSFIYGHVVDMLHFKFWGYDYPVFNLADSCIVVGVFGVLLMSWLEPSEGEGSTHE